MKNKIESILIVGGGSSGWMAAAAIVKQLPHIKVSLVESPNVPTIGVGESTLGQINQYFSFIGLEDKDWMKYCNATYKASIKFTDFAKNPEEKPYAFHYPFGSYDFENKPNGLMEWFIYKAKHPETPNENFAEFYHDSVFMIDSNKMTYNKDNEIRNFNPYTDLAYHMNASLFGEYLRDFVCKPLGLSHILANVTGATQDETGHIIKIITDKGELKADLYIDCTGFKSVLLEGIMGVEFESFNDILMNDRAIAAPIPYINKEKEMECVTNCTAIECGWVWNTPLWDRIGTGYVYSSKFASDEEALEQFKRHLKSDRMLCQDDARIDNAEFRFLKIRHGVHKKCWEKNVVAIGLSNGFIEPLESTGLLLTHESIIKLVNILKIRNGLINRFDVDGFNYSVLHQVISFKNFIAMHYSFSTRSDTPYWKHVTQNIQYFDDYSNVFDTNSMVDFVLNTHLKHEYNAQNMYGIPYIAAGMGYSPISGPSLNYKMKLHNSSDNYCDVVRKQWEYHTYSIKKNIEKMPSHYKFLENHIYS
jgi:Tryptophan halogenase